MMKRDAVDGEEGEPRYENFFVCNYGVGGNVLGEPVFDCGGEGDDDDVEDEEMPPMFRTMDIEFAERLPLADESARGDIRSCLDTVACLKEHRDDSSVCGTVLQKCLVDLPEAEVTRRPAEELEQLAECRIEFVLCRLSDGSEFCRIRRRICLGLRRGNASTTSLESSTTMAPTTTTVQLSTTTMTTTTTTKVLSDGGVAMVGSSSVGEDRGVVVEDVTTEKAEDADEDDEGKDGEDGKQSFTPPFVTTTESYKGESGPSEQVADDNSSRIDLTYYDTGPRLTVRLALCLKGARCLDGSPGCGEAQTRCAAGFGLESLHAATRRKLCECLVADMLCHLNREEDADPGACKRSFQACADDVVPQGQTVEARPPDENQAGEWYRYS